MKKFFFFAKILLVFSSILISCKESATFIKVKFSDGTVAVIKNDTIGFAVGNDVYVDKKYSFKRGDYPARDLGTYFRITAIPDSLSICFIESKKAKIIGFYKK